MPVRPGDKAALLLSFGTRLESLIYQRYRSKDQFLAVSGFYKANLHGIITGKSDPQLSTLFRLAKALGMSVSDLLHTIEVDIAAAAASQTAPGKDAGALPAVPPVSPVSPSVL